MTKNSQPTTVSDDKKGNVITIEHTYADPDTKRIVLHSTTDPKDPLLVKWAKKGTIVSLVERDPSGALVKHLRVSANLALPSLVNGVVSI